MWLLFDETIEEIWFERKELLLLEVAEDSAPLLELSLPPPHAKIARRGVHLIELQ